MSSTNTPPGQAVRRITDNEVFQHMHRHNIAAHRAGKTAGRSTRRRDGSSVDFAALCPADYTTDQAYWWQEGFFQRPFNPLTDYRALQEHRQVMACEQARQTRTP